MKTIVLIEDHEDLAQLVQYKLKKEGYKVIWKADGLSGLEEVRATRPDLVLLDVMLPKMDGFEVLDHLRADVETKPIPIVMLTALSQEQDVVRGFEHGATDYMVKPLRPAELVSRVNKLLGGPQ